MEKFVVSLFTHATYKKDLILEPPRPATAQISIITGCMRHVMETTDDIAYGCKDRISHGSVLCVHYVHAFVQTKDEIQTERFVCSVPAAAECTKYG